MSQRLSVDFAAIYFACALYEDAANKRAQDAFHAHLQTLASSSGDRTSVQNPNSYLVAFMPGYACRIDTATGADFARQRQILRRLGWRTALVATDELGTVERNAEVVADWLRRMAHIEQEVILVSASKGGAEVALALGEHLSANESAHIKAWISVGGLLRGTPYADHAQRWPRRWLAAAVLRLKGLRPEIISNMSTTLRRPVFNGLQLPQHVLQLQFVGIPLSGHIGPAVRRRYEILRPSGQTTD